MIERREHLRLARESRQPIRVAREQLGQDLERDVAIEFRVARAIDLAHAALPKPVEDLVSADSAARGEAHGVRRLSIEITNTGTVWAEVRAPIDNLKERVQTSAHG